MKYKKTTPNNLPLTNKQTIKQSGIPLPGINPLEILQAVYPAS